MSGPYAPGDEVTILPPYADDPIVISLQRYAHVVDPDAGDGLVAVKLTDVHPANQRFAFPRERLARGWKDANGRWQ